MTLFARRPGPGDYPAVYRTYVETVPDGDVLDTLERQGADTAALLRSVPVRLEEHRYAPDRWSVREVVAHVIDAERLFTFRALHVARGDPAPLPGMDQDVWARSSNAAVRPLSELVEELEAVRRATVLLFRGMDDRALRRTGVANDTPLVVWTVPWVVAGHERHHVNVLRERYFGSTGAAGVSDALAARD